MRSQDQALHYSASRGKTWQTQLDFELFNPNETGPKFVEN